MKICKTCKYFEILKNEDIDIYCWNNKELYRKGDYGFCHKKHISYIIECTYPGADIIFKNDYGCIFYEKK